MARLLALVAVSAYAAHLVAQRTIAVVEARPLLPRWDLATHLGHGWVDYHLLVTGQIHRLLADVWSQGYWPPGLSIFQIPFYVVLGPDLTSGLWSGVAAFLLVAALGAAILLRQQGGSGVAGAASFVALMISSPFLLAYASVTMTEMLGAAAQLLVIFCYLRWRERGDARRARYFALSLTVLFFVKYNYFVLLAAPLVVHEWLERTAGWDVSQKVRHLWRAARRLATSPSFLIVAVYLAALLAIVSTGGFQFRVLGQRVSVRGIGSSGHVVLYGLLLRLWYLHRRGRIDWQRLFALDERVRPLLFWFAVPVTLWLASPYPNHLRDFANLVVNRPMGEPTASSGLASYIEALRTLYFYSDWTLAGAGAAFAAAAASYHRQPAVMRLLILTVPVQFAAIGLHQTRFPRFLLLTVVLLCLVAAAEVARSLGRAAVARAAGVVMAALVLLAGSFAAARVVGEQRFRTVAFENYTESESLVAAMHGVRGQLHEGDRLLVIGQSNELSPALLRWELGPPSGEASFPFPVGGAGRLDPDLATKILLLVPRDPGAVDLEYFDPSRLEAVKADIAAGELTLEEDYPVPDLRVWLRLYSRRPGLQ